MSFFDIHTHKVNKEDKNVISIYNYLTFRPNENTNILIPDNVFLSAGIHPWYIDKDNLIIQFEQLENELKHNQRIVAIGECGLDCLAQDMDLQRKVFCQHLHLANQYQLPIIIHCVKAWEQLLQILKSEKLDVPCIVHGFRGGKELAIQLLNKGLNLSLGIYYNASALPVIPLPNLFLETDDSDSFIPNIYLKIASDLNVEEDILKQQIEQNVKIFPF